MGAVIDVRGNGKDMMRGGCGIYTDFGYTNSNVLFAAADSSGQGFGNVFNVGPVASGICTVATASPCPSALQFRVGQPLSLIQSQNQAAPLGPGQYPLFGQWVDPTLQQPYQIQTNAGWSHELNADTAVSADFVYSLGRDLNMRPRVNQRIPGSLSNPRIISNAIGTNLNPNANSNRPAASLGKSEYDALIIGLRRRMSKGVDFSVGYTLGRSLSTIGVGVDQLNTANIQDPNNPFDAPVQFGPTVDTDARHRINLTATFQ